MLRSGILGFILSFEFVLCTSLWHVRGLTIKFANLMLGGLSIMNLYQVGSAEKAA